MPISAENKAKYGPCWPMISLEIRERSGQRCELCRVKNHDRVCRGRKGSKDEDSYMTFNGDVFCASTGAYLGDYGFHDFAPGNMVDIVLTVAHMNHDVTDMSEESLKALCQRCHLRYDLPHHLANSARTRASKRAMGDLFDTLPV
jgi:hypothetical protein